MAYVWQKKRGRAAILIPSGGYVAVGVMHKEPTEAEKQRVQSSAVPSGNPQVAEQFHPSAQASPLLPVVKRDERYIVF